MSATDLPAAGAGGLTGDRPVVPSVDGTQPATAGATDGRVPSPIAAERVARARRADPRFRREERDWLRRRLAVLLADALTWTVGLLPWPARFWLADRAGDLWHRLAPTYRGNVRANLAQALGIDPTDPALAGLVRGVFRQNARNFLDLFRMPHWDGDDLARLVPIVAGEWATLEAARAAGKGMVLVTAHLGAFDVVGHAVGARGYKLTAVTGRTTARFLFDVVNHLRRGHNVATVEATPSGVRKVIQALRRNEVAVFLADYDFFRNGLPVTLFGRETTLPPGPVRIARDAGAPVVGVFARRATRGYALAITPLFSVPKTRDLEADVAAGMAKLAAMLEAAITAVPEQWVILQRVWPEAPAALARAVPTEPLAEDDAVHSSEA